MNEKIPIYWLAAIGILAAPLVWAQAPPPAASAPFTPAVGSEYRSAFEGYQRFKDEKVQRWKDSNATVERIGGWRAYAKEAQESKPTDTKPAEAKAANPHSGHAKP